MAKAGIDETHTLDLLFIECRQQFITEIGGQHCRQLLIG